MRPLASFAALAIVALLASSSADARKRDRNNDGWGDRYDRWENRRDARRAGIVAGVVASGIARGAAAANANEHYQECMMSWGYDTDWAQSPGRSENGQRLEQDVNTAGPSRAFSCCDAVDPAKYWARATRIVSLSTVAFPYISATGLCSGTVPEAVAARRHRRGEDSPSPHPRIPSPHSSPGRRSAKISIT
jgi:hypothetical protein